MTTNELKKHLQDHLSDGLVLIIGSGLSAASGLPTMGQLANHLISNPPPDHTKNLLWSKFCEQLEAGVALETALHNVQMDHQSEEHIVKLTALLIESKEAEVIKNVFSNTMYLPLGKLIKHLLTTENSLPIVTNNYDRLIEVATEIEDIEIDTSFVGHFAGQFNIKMSHESLGCAALTHTGKSIKRLYRKHVKLFKPHGSLDWYDHNGVSIRSAFSLDLPRLMITPGQHKYLKGYEQPFDKHREAANASVDKAARFLIIGYGFNDIQLETHLKARLESGVPCILLTKELTPNAKNIVSNNKNIMALSEASDGPKSGTTIDYNGKQMFFENVHLWSLENFVMEVL